MKTTSKIRYEYYEFVVMSFGLTNALVDFMDLINKVLRIVSINLLWSSLMIY